MGADVWGVLGSLVIAKAIYDAVNFNAASSIFSFLLFDVTKQRGCNGSAFIITNKTITTLVKL